VGDSEFRQLVRDRARGKGRERYGIWESGWKERKEGGKEGKREGGREGAQLNREVERATGKLKHLPPSISPPSL